MYKKEKINGIVPGEGCEIKNKYTSEFERNCNMFMLLGMIQNRGDFYDTVERRNITRASSLGRQESKGPAEQAMRLGVDGTMAISFIVTDRKQRYGCR